MKNFAENLIRKHMPPALRLKLRETAGWSREQIHKLQIWRWRIRSVPRNPPSDAYEIIYFGREENLNLAKAILRVGDCSEHNQQALPTSRHRVLLSELPLPGAIRVPCLLRVLIPLGKNIDEVTAGFDNKLRRVLRQQRTEYRTQKIDSDADIDYANSELLQPYATARHGETAAQICPNVVRKIAQKTGRLDLVISNGKTVGCILAGTTSRSNKRYWSLIRCGYPEYVFSDSKRLREINAINFYLALEWAIDNGFDYYDMGDCLGSPEDGLLQWKKRWGGMLDVAGLHSSFYIKLPSTGTAQFLWDSPIFGIEKKGISLHLGLPAGETDESFALRYREMNRGMGIGGLSTIYLHSAIAPGKALLEEIQGHYAHQKSPPVLKIIQSS